MKRVVLLTALLTAFFFCRQKISALVLAVAHTTEVFTEITLIPTTQPNAKEANSKDILLGLGILSTISFGLFWITRKVLRKIFSLFRNIF